MANQDNENPLLPQSPGIRVYHPRTMAVPRVATQARWQLLIEGRSRPLLQAFLQQWLQQLSSRKTSKVRWHIDVDPLEI